MNTVKPQKSNKPTKILGTDLPVIIKEESASSRAVEYGSESFIKIANLTESIFNRQIADLSSVLLNILFKCNLKSLIVLRSTARGFKDLVSYISHIHREIACSPLMDKAALSFKCCQLNLQVNAPEFPVISQKFEFAEREKLEMQIEITVADLRNASQLLNTVDEKRLKILLKVKTPLEIQLLQTLLSNHPLPKFIDKIKGIDLGNFYVDNITVGSINTLLMTIAQNIVSFKNLTNLTFGEIKNNVTLVLPDSPAFNCITKLIFGKICYHASCTIPSSFFNLRYLSTGDIGDEGSFFSSNKEPLKFQLSLPNLVDLKIGSIKKGVILNFPQIDNIENLIVGLIDGKINKAHSLVNLKNLTITELGGPFDDKGLNSFINLTSLTIKIFRGKSISCDLTCSLPNLTKLKIGDLDGRCILRSSFPNLTNLSIKKIDKNNCFAYETLLPNLTNLSIKNVQTNYVGESSSSGTRLHHMQGEVRERSIQLPESLNNLTNLNINGHNAILHIPKNVGGFKTFIIETPYDDVTRKLLNAINKKLNVKLNVELNVENKKSNSEVCSCQ